MDAQLMAIKAAKWCKYHLSDIYRVNGADRVKPTEWKYPCANSSVSDHITDLAAQGRSSYRI